VKLARNWPVIVFYAAQGLCEIRQHKSGNHVGRATYLF
jgi:hypothetical protein